jgi:hypothetical protein
MTTGLLKANIVNKSLLGYQDLADRLLSYNRQLAVDQWKAMFPVGGAFTARLTLSGPAANTIRVLGSSLGSDGLGNIIDIAQGPTRDALFENTNAILYYIGLKYAELPSGIRISPRDGMPQFSAWLESVGVSANPTSVTDNGNGTLTFNVNSVCESGVTSSGRSVLVFKKIPDKNAVTYATAVETRTVAYSNPNNTITTTGTFGQLVPSTTASDYTVVMLGPAVRRNTNLSAAAGYFFIGTVTGNAGTPSSFDNSGQTLLQVQTVITPLDFISVRGASTGNVSLSGALTHDGVTYSTGNLFLAKDQTTGSQNGVYTVNTSGAWTRYEGLNWKTGLQFYVQEGTINAKSNWEVVTTGAITVGTTTLVIEETAQRHVKTTHWASEIDNGNSGTSKAIDWRVGQKQKLTLTGNLATFTWTAPPGPCNLILKLIQGGAGSFTVTWPAAVLWPDNIAPVLTTTVGKIDIVAMYYDGTNYFASCIKNF